MTALTERRLVALLEGRFGSGGPGVLLGIGDDAAVLAPASEPWVCSVDASVEGVHFDTRWLSYEDVGFRAFQAAISDLAAMGATPSAALSALVLPRALSAQAIERLTAGIARASLETGCPVVGGNLSRGGELSLTTTVLGRAERPLTRSGARPGDQLWLIGDVGLAAAGLALLRRAAAPGARPALRPDSGAEATASALAAAPAGAPLNGLERCIAAWRQPRALLEAGRQLVGRASAAIDLSDGLAADAARLAEASRVRIVVDRERLRASLQPALVAAGRRLKRSRLRLALVGGEDYALLATGPGALRPPCASVIGYVARGAGAFLSAERGLVPLSGGFDHLRT